MNEVAGSGARVTRSDTPRRRSDRAIRNDGLLVGAAVEAIVDRGVDHVAVRDVASRAGLTTGALYGRFDGVGDLLAEAWAERCGPAFEAVVMLARAVADDGPEAGPIGLVEHPAPELLAASELAVASSRVGELADVVPRDVRRWMRTAGLVEDPRAIGILGYLLGTVLYGAVDPQVRADVPTVLRWLYDGRAAAVAGPDPAPDPVLPVPLAFYGDDPVRDRLLDAAVQVAARSGIQHATLKRIARVAGCAPSFVYSRYDSRDALYADVVEIGRAHV